MSVNANSITTIDELISVLDTCKEGDYGFVASRIDIDPAAFSEFMTYSQDKYTRNCLKRTEDYELLLLGWEPNQITPIHYHDQKDCWVHIVKGDFEELLYLYDQESNEMEFVKETQADAGATTFMHDRMGLHSLQNKSEERAISLHLYVKPIESCLVWDAETKTLNEVKMSYDNVASFERTC